LKLFTVILLVVCIALSVCMLVPAPLLALLPLTIAVPEFSPWLATFSMLVCVVAFRYHRRLAPWILCCLLILAWPLAEIPGVTRRMSAQMPQSQPFRVLDLFRGLPAAKVEPETLPLNIRYYRPAGDGPRPGLIDIYGGAWQRGAPEDSREFHSYLASKGYAVFAIDYRHAPAFRYPAQIEDVRAAISFVHANAAQYRTDPNQLILCGRSAGGQLALLAAYESGTVPIRAVIAFYPPTDLAAGYEDLPSPDPIDVRQVLATYLGGSPAQVPEAYRTASPVTYAQRPVSPTLLIQGARDHIVKPRFPRELQRKLLTAGNRVVLLEIPWSEHAFDAVFPGIGNRLALHYIEQFLEQLPTSRRLP
jgi:acetyl esterase/lipase